MSDRSLIPCLFANVTPSDAEPLSNVICLLVGGAGNLVVKGVDGVQATIVVTAGQKVDGQFTRVMAATTATGIVACRAA